VTLYLALLFSYVMVIKQMAEGRSGKADAGPAKEAEKKVMA
jgi:hypothetical protein